MPLRRFEMCPGLQGTARASSRTPTPRAVIRRASSVLKSLMLRVPIAREASAVACLAVPGQTDNTFRLRRVRG